MNIFGAHITVRIGIPALAVGIAIAGIGFVIINQVQRAAVEKQAVKTAESVVAQMLATRAVYTKDVVSKLQTDGVNIEFGPDFREKQRHVPLPATMVHLISDEVNKQGLYTIDLISPWAINPAKLPAPGWEKESTDALIADPRTPQSKIETSGGDSKLLYMDADFASKKTRQEIQDRHSQVQDRTGEERARYQTQPRSPTPRPPPLGTSVCQTARHSRRSSWAGRPQRQINFGNCCRSCLPSRRL